MKYLITLFLGVLSLAISAQTIFYNDGESVYLNEGAVMIVKTGSYHNENGITNNNGELTVEGDFINDASTEGGPLGSEFIILQNWENNQDFAADSCNVILNGTTQSIKGTAVSTFYDLTLENGDIKTQEIDAEVSNTLYLNESELATTDYKMTILNPDMFAIDFIEDFGFVSSTNDGRLVRNTSSNNTYIFPVGETNNGLKYRPIEISPSTTTAQQFETRLVYDNATTEGFPLSNTGADIDELNEKFFHYIQQTQGTEEAALTIYYDASIEGDWSEIARYESTSLWTNLDNGSTATTGILDGVTKTDWQNNTSEPHILINTKDVVVPPPPQDELYAIPNVFTPLGNQNENTYFGVINQNNLVNVESIQVFNRWGEEVFNGQDTGTDTWDGYHEGKLQPTGNYVYLIQLRDNNSGKLLEAITGNILMIW